MNILLVCASGMSTGLLMSKMKAEREKQQINNMDIFACSVDEMEKYINNYDVVLIAPQICYKEKYIKALATSRKKSCGVINGINYGRVDAIGVLEQAFNLVKQKQDLREV